MLQATIVEMSPERVPCGGSDDSVERARESAGLWRLVFVGIRLVRDQMVAVQEAGADILKRFLTCMLDLVCLFNCLVEFSDGFLSHA
jgi:hypothetical protein